MWSDISGQRVLVTAAGGGAGRIIASRFATSGAKVFACDIDKDGLASLASAYPSIETIGADASCEDDISAVIERVEQTAGGIDVLVNNVGIGGPTAPMEDISLEEWNTSLSVNLTSHFLFARGVVPAMKAQGSGLIVNISSASAKTGLPLRLPYVVTKGGVLSMTMNLARELGPFGIRVNAILPGPIRGDRINKVIESKAAVLGVTREDYEASLVRYTSLRTMVEPDDIADMIGFLASSGGARISGQAIGVDGNQEWEE